MPSAAHRALLPDFVCSKGSEGVRPGAVHGREGAVRCAGPTRHDGAGHQGSRADRFPRTGVSSTPGLKALLTPRVGFGVGLHFSLERDESTCFSLYAGHASPCQVPKRRCLSRNRAQRQRPSERRCALGYTLAGCSNIVRNNCKRLRVPASSILWLLTQTSNMLLYLGCLHGNVPLLLVNEQTITV